jgi:hypothetical protein
MTKIRTTLTIEKEIYENARKHIPNISEFLEECLKQYLGLADGIYPTANVKDLVDDIAKSQAKLFILNQNYDYEKAQKEVEDEKVNRPLRKLWNEYRKSLIADEQLMSEALEVLPTDAETLEDMLDFAYVNQEELGLNFTWNKLCELYETEEVE